MYENLHSKYSINEFNTSVRKNINPMNQDDHRKKKNPKDLNPMGFL